MPCQHALRRRPAWLCTLEREVQLPAHSMTARRSMTQVGGRAVVTRRRGDACAPPLACRLAAGCSPGLTSTIQEYLSRDLRRSEAQTLTHAFCTRPAPAAPVRLAGRNSSARNICGSDLVRARGWVCRRHAPSWRRWQDARGADRRVRVSCKKALLRCGRCCCVTCTHCCRFACHAAFMM